MYFPAETRAEAHARTAAAYDRAAAVPARTLPSVEEAEAKCEAILSELRAAKAAGETSRLPLLRMDLEAAGRIRSAARRARIEASL